MSMFESLDPNRVLKPAALEISDLTVNIRGRVIFERLNLRVNSGEIVSIEGPNGAGKSTLVRAICGLEGEIRGRVLEGRILLNGRDVTEIRAVERTRLGLSVMPQDRRNFANLTVAENLRAGLQVCPKSGRHAAIREIYKLFPPLASLAKRRSALLSGGEQALLAFAKATISNPTVLILDEPTRGVSPDLRATIFRQIRRLADGAAAVVVVEHLRSGESLQCDHSLRLSEGSLIMA